jgi:hypothetical protein
MSLENLEKFQLFVWQNPALQKELQNIPERDVFIARVVELGAQSGFEFTAGEVLEMMRENQRTWIERWI